MQIVLEVCDICGKKHGTMLKRDGMVFGDRSCFLDFCNSVWLKWEKEEFEARGVIQKRDPHVLNQQFEQILEKSALLFKPKVYSGTKSS
jgi:hypothetical protein